MLNSDNIALENNDVDDITMAQGQEIYSTVPVKKRDQLMKELLNGSKPHLMLLNEYFNVKFEHFQSVGTIQAPQFTCNVPVNGLQYEGSGSSKKGAMKEVAMKVLQEFVSRQLEQESLNMVNEETPTDQPNKELISSEAATATAPKRTKEIKDSPQRKKRKVDPLANVGERSPVAILNELRSGLIYTMLEQSGPSHLPTFKVYVEVDGQKYYGQGGSKKEARCKAAEAALKSFIQFPNNCKIVPSTACNQSDMDFTSDSFEDKTNQMLVDVKRPDACQRNASMLLNTLYPGAQYTCSDNGDIYARFTVTVNVNGEMFSGTGSNKKMAKHAAATTALAKLSSNTLITSGTNITFGSAQQELADCIGRAVTEKFISLMRNDVPHAKRKVLAGIIMQRPTGEMDVISVATGTKCISGEHISMQGAAVYDLHGEVIARRAFKAFLYAELNKHISGLKETSIFEKSSTAGFKLRDGIEFHLYINTAPCGDARIFSPHEEYSAKDRHPNRTSRGLLRTKIESGEGTLPIRSHIQTWDGILQGEPLLTMACSDKIACWNVVGLQGALLTHFIEPIYLSSITLGGLFHETHLYRAICGRVEPIIQGLTPPYRLNRPNMNLVTSIENRQPLRSPSFAVNWLKDSNDVEVINTTTGRQESGEISRLSKLELFKKFSYLAMSLPCINPIDSEAKYYRDFKLQATTYQEAKLHLYDAFTKAGLGKWVSKPLECDQFEI